MKPLHQAVCNRFNLSRSTINKLSADSHATLTIPINMFVVIHCKNYWLYLVC
ncbi:MAG: hypothetical protein ACKPKO_64020 [Candidatus Fonsibacter sp.]